jgi:signal transduction histidine kinase/ligand-binding sensor domain-containing protein/CheY-like chemotaxis protein
MRRECPPLSVRSLMLCVLLGVAAPAAASPDLALVPQNRFARWSSDDALPAAHVYDITQTPDGYLWVATLDGLVRYDGERFTIFNAATTDAIGDSSFTCAMPDDRGALWAGTQFRTIYRYLNGAWSSWTLPPAGFDSFVRLIVKESSGAMVAFAGIEAYELTDDGPVLRAYDEWARLASEATVQYAGRRGLVAPRAMLALVDGRVRAFTTDAGLATFEGVSVFEDGAGTLFLLARDGQIHTPVAGQFRPVRRDGMLARLPPSGAGARLYGDRRGALWFARDPDPGIQRVDPDGTATSFGKEFGFDDRVTAFFEDAEGTLWIGGLRGLYRYKGDLISYVSYVAGAPLSVYDFAGEDGDGRPLIFTYEGAPFGRGTKARTCTLNLWRNGALEPLATVPFTDYGPPPVLLTARDGTLWFTANTMVFRMRGGKLVPFPDGPGLAVRESIGCLTEDREGTIWFGTIDGLYAFREGGEGGEGALRHFTAADGLATSGIGAFQVGRDGTLWCASYGGLSAIRDGRITAYTAANGLPNDRVRTLYEDAAGTLWIGTLNGGLGRFKDGVFSSITQKEGLFNNGVFAIVEDEAGNFWMSCNRGIYRARKADLETVADGRAARVDCVAYGVADGMRVAECNGGYQAAVRRLRDGRFGFDSQDGMVVVDPRARPALATPPPIAIESVLRDGGEQSAAGPLEVRPGEESFEIRYSAPSFVKAEFVRFRYRLEGLEEQWVDAGSRRSAPYSRVPPGEYSFVVTAANADGVWNETGARLRVVVIPPFWRTWWFYGLMLTLAVLVGYAGYRTRIAALHRRHRVEQESLRKTADDLEMRVRSRTVQLEAEVADRRRAEEAAEAANRAKSVFLANMSHELRTPLNAVLGFAQLMEQEQSLAERERDHLAMIQRSGEHLLSLINDVLSIAKIEAGRLVPIEIVFDLPRFLGDIGNMVRVRAEGKGLRLAVAVDPSLPHIVLGDEGKLRQVLINLLGNAVKFTDAGVVTLRVRRAAGADERVSFEVEDTGCGIARGDLDGIFEAFAQADSGRQAEGTGLGLTISRQFVRLMGGDIRVRSEVGKGSVFAFDLALPTAEQSSAPSHVREYGALAEGQPAWRILVVDDTRDNRALLTQLLASVGFEVREASNGLEGIEVMSAWHPHLVFLDWRMPVMDGRETVERIRNDECSPIGGINDESKKGSDIPHHTKVVALTASAFDHDRDEILALGCDGFITKPFRAATIFDEIARQLGARYTRGAGVDEERRDEECLSVGRLEKLPTEIRNDLHTALSRGDDEAALDVVRRVGALDASLAGELERKLHEFEIEDVLRLLELIPKRSA